jgi:hypothetical protein
MLGQPRTSAADVPIPENDIPQTMVMMEYIKVYNAVYRFSKDTDALFKYHMNPFSHSDLPTKIKMGRETFDIKDDVDMVLRVIDCAITTCRIPSGMIENNPVLNECNNDIMNFVGQATDIMDIIYIAGNYDMNHLLRPKGSKKAKCWIHFLSRCTQELGHLPKPKITDLDEIIYFIKITVKPSTNDWLHTILGMKGMIKDSCNSTSSDSQTEISEAQVLIVAISRPEEMLKYIKVYNQMYRFAKDTNTFYDYHFGPRIQEGMPMKIKHDEEVLDLETDIDQVLQVLDCAVTTCRLPMELYEASPVTNQCRKDVVDMAEQVKYIMDTLYIACNYNLEHLRMTAADSEPSNWFQFLEKGLLEIRQSPQINLSDADEIIYFIRHTIKPSTQDWLSTIFGMKSMMSDSGNPTSLQDQPIVSEVSTLDTTIPHTKTMLEYIKAYNAVYRFAKDTDMFYKYHKDFRLYVGMPLKVTLGKEVLSVLDDADKVLNIIESAIAKFKVSPTQIEEKEAANVGQKEIADMIKQTIYIMDTLYVMNNCDMNHLLWTEENNDPANWNQFLERSIQELGHTPKPKIHDKNEIIYFIMNTVDPTTEDWLKTIFCMKDMISDSGNSTSSNDHTYTASQ